MKHLFHRIIATVLLAAMLVTAFPAGVLTAGAAEDPAPAADAVTAVSDDGTYRDNKMDTSYLRISMEKYGEKLDASSLGDAKDVTVLEYTRWQLQATFVQIYEGELVEERDVTAECTWTSGDSTGNALTVSSAGVVTAYAASDVPYTVTASYEGLVAEPGTDSTVMVPETFTASFQFHVALLSINAEDAEAMRCLAFTYLANFEWENMSSKQGMMISEWIDSVQRGLLYEGSSIGSVYHDLTVSNIHLKSHDSYENSATVLHFLSAAAGSSVIEVCAGSSDTEIRAASFRFGTERYIAYAFSDPKTDAIFAEKFAAHEGNGTRRIELIANHTDYAVYSEYFLQGMALYKAIVGSDDATVVGQYYGGTVAKYVSYVSGCDCVTFNAPSPIQYVFFKNFEELCQYFNVNNQVDYIYPEYPSVSTMYAIEPGYRVYRQFNNAVEFGMLQYNTVEMSIAFSKSEIDIARPQNIWNRRVYLGIDGDDEYQDDASPIKMFESCLFGGTGNDLFIVKTNQSGAINLILKAKNIWEWGEFIFGEEFATLLNKEKWLKKLKADLPEIIYELTTASIIDSNIVVGGKGMDKVFASYWSNSYCYTPGDGDDIYYLDGLHNKFYLMGYGDSKVSVQRGNYYVDPATNRITVPVTVNGTDKFDIDITNWVTGKIEFYQGSPFDNGLKPIYTIEASQIFTENTVLAESLDTSTCYTAACPVDMLVFDASGSLVQELLDGTEYSAETEYGLFDVSLKDGEYVKTAIVYDDSYTIQLRGVGDGTMRYSMVRPGSDTEEGQYCSIGNIPVTKGALYHASEDLAESILSVDADADGVAEDTIVYDTTVSFPQESMQLSFGRQEQLVVEVTTSSTDTDCFWLSTDESVVTVDETGLLTAVGFGEATVYTMVADGSESCASITVTVPEEALSAESFTVTGLESSYPYTGDAIDVSLGVSYGTLSLVQGIHYTVSFSELVEPGKATLTITGINDYSGTLVLDYEILAPKEPETVEEKVDWIAQQCRAEDITGEWETALWLHDWLIYNANYDYTYTYYHPNGVLLEGTGVCQSYAEAYALLLDVFGIENQIIVSPEMDHAWNLVKLDGEWCHIDCTWDDPGVGGAENHLYFGINDALISRDHIWPASGYPAATSTKNYYPVRMGENVVETAEELESLLGTLAESQTETFSCYYIGNDSTFSLMDAFLAWFTEYDWKYGLAGYGITDDDWMITVGISYTQPWDPPVDISDGVDCLDFTLRGPEGVYPLSNYSENGMILIFGRVYCTDTQGLLSQLNGRTGELRAQGIQTFVNLEYTQVPSDFDEIKTDFPNFTYTYGDEFLQEDLLKLVPSDSGWYTYYPLVFVINRDAKITYYHSGYVADVADLLEAAGKAATNNPLPEPEPVDDNYLGSVFRYTGDREALAEMISRQLAARQPHIVACDGTWDASQGDWSDEVLGSVMMELLDQYRSNTDLYTIPYEWDYDTYYQQVNIDIQYAKDAAAHFPDILEAEEATCTGSGLTEGSYCKVCGTVLLEQEVIPALGHTEVTVTETAPTCTEPGWTETRCSVCEEVIQETIPALGHSFQNALDTTCDVCGFVREVAELKPLADCPYFTLHGPDGVYPTINYGENGILLIFGRTDCWYTSSLLSTLNSRTEELAAQGVQTFVNIDGASYPADLQPLQSQYPNFTYTYGDIYLISRLLSLAGESSASYTYPLVFVLNRDSEILYYASGHVADTEGLLGIAAVTATDVPLPDPEPVDEAYIGSVFHYTGNREALADMIAQQIERKNMYIAARDGTQDASGDSWNTEILGSAMVEILDQYRSCTTDFTAPGWWSFFPDLRQVQMDIEYGDTPAGHTPVPIAGKDATCTESGLTEGSYCSVCKVTIREQEEIPAKGHTETTVIPGKEATCTGSGLTPEKKCTVCGTVTAAQQVIPSAGHREVTVSGGAASCTEDGLTDGRQCSVCGITIVAQQTIPAAGHAWDDGSVITEATEELPGETRFTCTTCGETETRTIPPLSHVHEYTAAVTAPTCTEQGYTTHTCTCGDSYTDTYVDALGHDHSGGVCTVCGASSPGDLNGDGSVNEADATYLVWYTLFPELYPIEEDADFNADQAVTAADAVRLLWYVLFPEQYPL